MFSPLGSKCMTRNVLYMKEDEGTTLIKSARRNKQKTVRCIQQISLCKSDQLTERVTQGMFMQNKYGGEIQK